MGPDALRDERTGTREVFMCFQPPAIEPRRRDVKLLNGLMPDARGARATEPALGLADETSDSEVILRSHLAELRRALEDLTLSMELEGVDRLPVDPADRVTLERGLRDVLGALA
jgi:hypothetical protein